MQAIVTKTYGPTDQKGARIKAKCDAGSITIPHDYSHQLGDERTHRGAAIALCKKLGWNGKMVGGCLPDGRYAFVFVRTADTFRVK